MGNDTEPTLLGWIWIFTHPDCINCIYGALYETVVFSPAAIACIASVLDIIPGDEFFLCAYAGLQVESVIKAWATCSEICGEPPA